MNTPWPRGVLPIVAILRGVGPDEIVDVARALCDAGIRAIEIPLNSPQALRSILQLSGKAGADALCGAGTVVSVADVDVVHEAGGRLIVSPNTDPDVIERACRLGMHVMPGFATPTEAFQAIRAGARHLKLFPAASFGTRHLKALLDVLPRHVGIFPVGGVAADNAADWVRAGAAGIGVGGELYRPGISVNEVSHRARLVVAAWQAAKPSAGQTDLSY